MPNHQTSNNSTNVTLLPKIQLFLIHTTLELNIPTVPNLFTLKVTALLLIQSPLSLQFQIESVNKVMEKIHSKPHPKALFSVINLSILNAKEDLFLEL
jgi:hypothetical protein